MPGANNAKDAYMIVDTRDESYNLGNIIFIVFVSTSSVFTILNLPFHTQMLKILQIFTILSYVNIALPKIISFFLYNFVKEQLLFLLHQIKFLSLYWQDLDSKARDSLVGSKGTGGSRFFKYGDISCDLFANLLAVMLFAGILYLVKIVHCGFKDILLKGGVSSRGIFSKNWIKRACYLSEKPYWFYFLENFGIIMGFVFSMTYHAFSLVNLIVSGIIAAYFLFNILLTFSKISPPTSQMRRTNRWYDERDNQNIHGFSETDRSALNKDGGMAAKKNSIIRDKNIQSQLKFSEEAQTEYTKKFIHKLVEECEDLRLRVQANSEFTDENTFGCPWWCCKSSLPFITRQLSNNAVEGSSRSFKLVGIMFDLAFGIMAAIFLNSPFMMIYSCFALLLGFAIFSLASSPYQTFSEGFAKIYPYLVGSFLFGGLIIYSNSFWSKKTRDGRVTDIYWFGMVACLVIGYFIGIISLVKFAEGDEDRSFVEQFKMDERSFVERYTQKNIPRDIVRLLHTGKLKHAGFNERRAFMKETVKKTHTKIIQVEEKVVPKKTTEVALQTSFVQENLDLDLDEEELVTPVPIEGLPMGVGDIKKEENQENTKEDQEDLTKQSKLEQRLDELEKESRTFRRNQSKRDSQIILLDRNGADGEIKPIVIDLAKGKIQEQDNEESKPNNNVDGEMKDFKLPEKPKEAPSRAGLSKMTEGANPEPNKMYKKQITLLESHNDDLRKQLEFMVNFSRSHLSNKKNALQDDLDSRGSSRFYEDDNDAHNSRGFEDSRLADEDRMRRQRGFRGANVRNNSRRESSAGFRGSSFERSRLRKDKDLKRRRGGSRRNHGSLSREKRRGSRRFNR